MTKTQIKYGKGWSDFEHEYYQKPRGLRRIADRLLVKLTK